jgi:hypothetical protein
VNWFVLVVISAGLCFAQQEDPGGPPKFYPAHLFEDPTVRELRLLREQLSQQADWEAIYQLYPNNPALYRWLARNPHKIPHYLGR